MMPLMVHRAAAALLVLAIIVPSIVSAEIFRYTDSRGVSHYVDSLHSVPEAYRASAVPVGVRSDPASTSPSIETAPAAVGTTIRYTPGKTIVVDARINGATGTKLVLDTGADRTVISPRALAAAGVSLASGTFAGRLQGATGSTDVQAVPIDSLAVGEARVTRMLVISHDVDQSGIDGLLGRDFLDQFKVTIDSASGIVTLAPK